MCILALMEVVNIFPSGKGCFKLWFQTLEQANVVLTLSSIDLCLGLGLFARWMQGMDLCSLNGDWPSQQDFEVYIPNLCLICGRLGDVLIIGHVVRDVLSSSGEDRTPYLKMVFPSSLASDFP